MINYKYIIILGILLAFSLSGCYDEDTITSELGIDNLKPIDSNDPVDHYIYEFYTKYGTYIHYTYDTVNYQWDFSELRDDIFYTEQKDKDVLLKGLQYMETVFANLYTEEFKKNHFPVKILLAKSIDEDGYYGDKNIIADYSTPFLGLGRIQEGIEDTSEEDLQEAKFKINYKFWHGYLMANGKIQIPDAFFEVSREFHSQNLRLIVTTSDIDPDPSRLNPHNFGFFFNRQRFDYTSGKYYWAPSREEDVEQFFEMILSHTKTELDEIMEDSQKLQDKYTILTNYIKETFNFDIQAVAGY